MKSHTNIITPIFIGVISFLFLACGNDSVKEDVFDIAKIEVSETNPNGDSELALLMRKMFEDGEDIKALITNNEGNITEEYIQELERIHTATPTDADVKTPEFEAYTKLMIEEANVLFGSDSNRVQGFNNLVNRCINCHQSFCPGPIKRIKKLTIH